MSDFYVIVLSIAWIVALAVILRIAWLFLHRKRTADPVPSYAIGLDVTLYGGKTYYTVIDTTSSVYRVVDQGVADRLSIGEMVTIWAAELAAHYDGYVVFYVESNGSGHALIEHMRDFGLNVQPIFVTMSNKRHMTDVTNEALRSGRLEGYPWAENDGEDLSRRLAYYGSHWRQEVSVDQLAQRFA
jgi:hypothetical protein